MIRLFTALCKTLWKNNFNTIDGIPNGNGANAADNALSEHEAFLQETDAYKPYNDHCPLCGARGRLEDYGSYKRFLVCLTGDHIVSELVEPLRFKCSSCGHTHALLPDVIVPYSRYSLLYILTVLKAYFERTVTVVDLCDQYTIAISTLYRWLHRLYEHKQLLLGLLLSMKESPRAFINSFLCNLSAASARLQSFYHEHGFSFMQTKGIGATRTAPT